jgi:hypothetical protein
MHRCGALLAFVAVAAGAQDSGSEEDWVPLFNGRDLEGWTVKIRGHPVGENFASTFRVVDGLLTVAYDGYGDFEERFGHIFYAEPFSHYRLRVEYRFIGVEATNAPDWAIRNSGVMLHSQAPETMGLSQDFPISIEFQFLGGLSNGEARATGNVCSPGTRILYRGEPDTTHCIRGDGPTLDGDGWVVAEAVVLGGDRIEHLIDGRRVIEYGGTSYGGAVVSGHKPEMKPDGEALAAGYIALQSEGHPIQFRRVELLNLKGCTDARASNFKSYHVEPDAASCKY